MTQQDGKMSLHPNDKENEVKNSTHVPRGSNRIKRKSLKVRENEDTK